MAKRARVAVLISGNGSNLQALIDAANNPDYPAEIVLVISNKKEAYGLTRAKDAGIATAVISQRDYPDRASFDDALNAILLADTIEIVCLAGFMRILGSEFVHQWQARIINIHPSLLPKYKGLHTHQRALDSGDLMHGCTVHHVVVDLDAGLIIMQESLPIKAGETALELAKRVLLLEHRLYPQALKKLCQELQ